MDVLDEEVLQLWSALHRNQVKYILVGGFATNLHGHSRFTADLDIWIKDSTENRLCFRKALIACDLWDLPELETIEFIPGWTSLYLASGFEIDIMSFLKGFPQERFEECYQQASVAEIHGVPIRFLHKNHLIESKKASGRKQDLLDIEALEKLD